MNKEVLVLLCFCFAMATKSQSVFWKSYSINSSTFIFGKVGHCVRNLRIGDYLVCGTTDIGFGDRDAVLIKLDPDGNIIWSKQYGDTNHQEDFLAFVETSNDDYIAVGSTYDIIWDENDILITKTNANGNIIKSRTCGLGPTFSITQTSTNDYVITGGLGLFLKINASGEMEQTME